MQIPSWHEPNEQVAIIGRHHWSVPRLFELSRGLPVMEVSLDHLNIWHKYEGLSLRQFVMHMHAVHEADLDFPIILDEDGELMDGRHRIMKALFLGQKTIKAVRFDKNPNPDKITD